MQEKAVIKARVPLQVAPMLLVARATLRAHQLLETTAVVSASMQQVAVLLPGKMGKQSWQQHLPPSQ
jgi:hypothetical protein